MSLWSRERIEVWLAPDAIVLRRVAGGARGRELNRYRFDVVGVDSAHAWQPALALLWAKIEALAWRKADLHVVLSGHFTRLILMPWAANISERDAGAYAQHQLRTIYGDGAEEWAVCLGAAHPRLPRVAAAADRELLDQLKTQSAAFDLRLCSLRPWLSQVVDALPAKDDVLGGWLALVEPGGLQLACLEAGHCIDIRSARYAADPAPVLLSLLQQSAHGADRDTGDARLTVYAAQAPDCALLHQHGWRVTTATPEFA